MPMFAEFDSDTAADGQSLPSSLSSSKDVFNNIASYKFSEMRFNVRGYDSQYSSIYLNGIRFNDAMTGYGPWSLWSGLNDATRNQENTAGLRSSGYGIDGIGGTTNVNARASQMRKGFRASVVNGNSMYRFRAMVSYASGLLDNGWSYAFSFSTRQGGNSYVDGVYYNAYGYFASVEKRFGGDRHNLALTILGAPTERGAQQASTQEAYDLLSNNYYNPNVGKQDGKLRNSRVRDYHEPIVMLNYGFDISSNTKLAAAASFRFGKNGYSALRLVAERMGDVGRKIEIALVGMALLDHVDARSPGLVAVVVSSPCATTATTTRCFRRTIWIITSSTARPAASGKATSSATITTPTCARHRSGRSITPRSAVSR